MKYHRILLKLSGEALMGDLQYGIDPARISQYAQAIKEVVELGVELAIVIGGGNIFRGVSGASNGMDRVQGDHMGMLATVINRVARPTASRLTFPGMSLGVSLASGTHDHLDVITSFPGRPPRQQLVILGAAVGLVAWWETLFPGLRPAFCDGSYPKRGLATGTLKTALLQAAAASERIVFVVPPHLAAIRLADVPIPQETVVVPPTLVHESWIPCLEATAGHVLGRLASNGRVLVLIQANVFSAALGAFLLDARRHLFSADARLRIFDLGQALDIAAPDCGGLWAKQHAAGDRNLFVLGVD